MQRVNTWFRSGLVRPRLWSEEWGWLAFVEDGRLSWTEKEWIWGCAGEGDGGDGEQQACREPVMRSDVPAGWDHASVH